MIGSQETIRLLIATPCYGGNLHYQYVASLFQLTRQLDKLNVNYSVSFLGNESLITRARNIMVGKFLSDPSYTHLLFIDADIQFGASSALKLIEVDKDVSIGVYPAKSFHFDRIEKIFKKLEDPSNLKSLCLNYMLDFDLDASGQPQIDVNHRMIKVRYGTTGFMLIKRSVIERMIKAYPDLQYNNQKTCLTHNIKRDKLFMLFDCAKDPETNDYLSEDYYFSLLWRKLGGDIWADMESRLSHWGNYPFQGDLHAYLKAGMIQYQDS
ncbi:hypothetical protein Dvar_39050 [Desulfosarcina variabilis str. Montpellier]